MDESRLLANRLRTVFELHRFGVKMMRQNLRRRHPEASEQEIDDLLRRWMHDRPPDAPGVPSLRFTK